MSCKYKFKIDGEEYCGVPIARIIKGKRIDVQHKHCPYMNGFEKIRDDMGVPTVYGMCHEEAGEYLKELSGWQTQQLQKWLRSDKH